MSNQTNKVLQKKLKKLFLMFIERIISKEDPAEVSRANYKEINRFQGEWNAFVMEHSKKELIEEHLLKPLAGVDEFCNQLESLIDVDPCVVKCAVFRNDYFETKDGDTMKMVEYNNISVSLIAVATQTCKDKGGEPNSPLTGLLDLFKEACTSHREYYGLEVELRILMIVTDKDEAEGNVDQELICSALADTGIQVSRMTLKKAKDGLTLRNGYLYYKDTIVNLVYLRAGYTMMSPEEFEGRKMIEESMACKVNNANVQLFGMKYMQYKLCTLPDTPVGYKSLQVRMKPAEAYNEEEDSHVDWILKSNKEGGGSCIFDDITGELRRMNDKKGWLLMERINVKVQSNNTHEIGIYGGILTVNDQVKSNKTMGYLVRTKAKTVNESGVNAGYAKVNSLILK